MNFILDDLLYWLAFFVVVIILSVSLFPKFFNKFQKKSKVLFDLFILIIGVFLGVYFGVYVNELVIINNEKKEVLKLLEFSTIELKRNLKEEVQKIEFIKQDKNSDGRSLNQINGVAEPILLSEILKNPLVLKHISRPSFTVLFDGKRMLEATKNRILEKDTTVVMDNPAVLELMYSYRILLQMCIDQNEHEILYLDRIIDNKTIDTLASNNAWRAQDSIFINNMIYLKENITQLEK